MLEQGERIGKAKDWHLAIPGINAFRSAVDYKGPLCGHLGHGIIKATFWCRIVAQLDLNCPAPVSAKIHNDVDFLLLVIAIKIQFSGARLPNG